MLRNKIDDIYIYKVHHIQWPAKSPDLFRDYFRKTYIRHFQHRLQVLGSTACFLNYNLF
jgi:hypothetical protein